MTNAEQGGIPGEPDAGSVPQAADAVRIRKRAVTERVERVVPRTSEHADVERTQAPERDSGEIETLPDGSISIPVFEEELVVTRRRRVRERIVVRKRTVTEEALVHGDVLREHADVETDDATDEREEP